jgi:signal transduction histidine kinase
LVTDEARRQGISLREDMAPSDPVIMADRDQVVQAMLNVLLNAVEAMPEGGRMTVGTAVEGEEVVFAVEDTGPGFPPSERSKFLDPFFTTKKKGTGLGLAQVAGIMDAHGGRVTLGGQPGMGARVALHFAPASKDGPEA